MQFDGKAGYIHITPFNPIPYTSIDIPVSIYDQQGIDNDGVNIFVSDYYLIHKLDFSGNIIATSAPAENHLGGMVIVGDYIYVASSVCSALGTDVHFIYKYDKATLEQVAAYDVGDYFTICAGAIGYYDGKFYVGESFFDSDHFDRIVEFNASFEFVAEHLMTVKSLYGIQGIKYIPALNLFQINGHGNTYYRINAALETASIVSYTESFILYLQDFSVYGTDLLYNDRDYFRIIRYPMVPTLPMIEYTAVCEFVLTGGSGTRRTLFESSPLQWWCSCEVGTANTLKYSIQTTGTAPIVDTGIIPTYGQKHKIALTYKQDDLSKFYYDGVEIVSARGAPRGTLIQTYQFVVGTYRDHTDRFFPGEINNFEFYNRELTASEIKWPSVNIPGCLIKFKDIVNGKVPDYSGNMNHGVVHGGVTSSKMAYSIIRR